MRVTWHEADSAFAWKIVDEANTIVFASARCRFSTRLEAILDSARAAAALGVGGGAASSIDGEGRDGD